MTRNDAEAPRPEPAGDSTFSRCWPWLLVGLAAVPWACGLFARWFWPAELLTHFRFQWLIASGLVGLALLLVRRWRPLATCGVLALILGWPLLQGVIHHGGAGKFRQPEPGLRVVTANVLARNADAAPLLAYLAEVDPDLICLQEVDARWAASLAPLHATHPHRLVLPRPDNFGIAVYSKLPATLEELDCDGLPAIAAAVEWDDERVRVLNVHAVPPLTPGRLARRNRQMAFAARRAAAEDGPVIVCGDLNCAPWSPFFADLLDGRRAAGFPRRRAHAGQLAGGHSPARPADRPRPDRRRGVGLGIVRRPGRRLGSPPAASRRLRWTKGNGTRFAFLGNVVRNRPRGRPGVAGTPQRGRRTFAVSPRQPAPPHDRPARRPAARRPATGARPPPPPAAGCCGRRSPSRCSSPPSPAAPGGRSLDEPAELLFAPRPPAPSPGRSRSRSRGGRTGRRGWGTGRGSAPPGRSD